MNKNIELKNEMDLCLKLFKQNENFNKKNLELEQKYLESIKMVIFICLRFRDRPGRTKLNGTKSDKLHFNSKN